mmetsp:Transcript_18580/g.21351  ORF Transcript_18580/g.21351 Transcript_18580/m.21351 type:complete len:132 (-) Transcript_18580:67-462(-)
MSSSNDDNKYNGDWLLQKAFVGPELTEFPLPTAKKYILKISTTEEGSYNLLIKVGNTIRTSMKVLGKDDDNLFDKIQVKPPMSSRMMPPPELFELESYLTTSLPTFFKMIVSDDGNLIMTGETSELICNRC